MRHKNPDNPSVLINPVMKGSYLNETSIGKFPSLGTKVDKSSNKGRMTNNNAISTRKMQSTRIPTTKFHPTRPQQGGRSHSISIPRTLRDEVNAILKDNISAVKPKSQIEKAEAKK